MGIRILIADRQDMFREALRCLLESEPDFIVVEKTGDGEQVPKLVADLAPDVLLIDLNLRKRSGIEVLRDIASLEGKTCPILLTDKIEKSEIVETLRWGVRGIVWKHEPASLLYKSIRAVMDGEYWISRSGVRDLVRSLCSLTAEVQQGIRFRGQSLSFQQQQIVESIVSGCSNKDIARELSVSERTVKYHLTRIFSKLGVTGRMQLARVVLKSNSKNMAFQ
jgi:two-component system, NarL family, nitrate/nitrite response regulator NarL